MWGGGGRSARAQVQLGKQASSGRSEHLCRGCENRAWVTSLAGILPRSWSHYTVPAGMTVIQWVADFSERIKQLQNISLAAASGGAKELKVGSGS